MEPLTKVTICKHLQKTRENYCYSCNLYFCNECFISHIDLTRHISGNKQEIQRIIQNEQQIVTQNDDKLEEYALFVEVHKAKVSQREESKSYIDKFTKSESEEINSRKLGVITRESAKEGKRLQKELKHIDREYKRLLHDLEQRVVDVKGMFAIRVIDEEKFQFYTPEGSQEPKITELQREALLNQLELLESNLILEKKEECKQNKSYVFDTIFIIFGILLSILLILLIVYLFEGKEAKDNYGNQKSKLKGKEKVYDERIYESNNLNSNIGLLLSEKNSKVGQLMLAKANNTDRTENITQKEEEVIFTKENIANNILNIKSLKQAKSMSNTKYSETELLLDSTKNDIISYSNLIVRIWISLKNYSSSLVEYSHKDLLEYSNLIRYWAVYNYIGGTFIIISGTDFHGISIIWYEAKLVIGHILWMDSSNKVYLHQIIENDRVLAFYLYESGFLYSINMSNLVLINSGNYIQGFIWMGYNPIRPSKLEIIIITEIHKDQLRDYDYKTSLFSNNKTLENLNEGITALFKSVQLPKFVMFVSTNIVGYSSDTGSILQKYNRGYQIYKLIELANNRFGYLKNQGFYIQDLATLDFIEKFQTNNGIYLFYQIFPLSPDRNIFLALSTNLLIIRFDTKSVIWKGNIQTYLADLTSANQIKENIFLYSDTTGKIWIIDLNKDLHLLFLDLVRYEIENFNYYSVKPKIKTMSTVERANLSMSYTISQI